MLQSGQSICGAVLAYLSSVPNRDNTNQCQHDVCVSASAHRWQNHSENTTPCKVASAGCSPLHLSHSRREHGTISVVIGMATELLYNFLALQKYSREDPARRQMQT